MSRLRCQPSGRFSQARRVNYVVTSDTVGDTIFYGGFTKLFQSFHETSCRPKENGREHKNDPLRSVVGVIFLCLNAVFVCLTRRVAWARFGLFGCRLNGVVGVDSVVVEGWSSCFVVGLVLVVGQGLYFGELALAPVGLSGDFYGIVGQFCF